MTPLRPWRQNFRSVFGALSNDQAQNWEDYIWAAIKDPQPTPDELDEAMLYLCDQKNHSGSGGKPSVLNFAQQIRRGRNGTINSEKKRTDAIVERSIRIIRWAKTIEQIWEAICADGLDLQDRENLLDHATRTRPDMTKDGHLINNKNTVTMDEILRTVRIEDEGRKRREKNRV